MIAVAYKLDACAQAYADGMEDCDDDFAIASTVAIIEGIGFAIFTTPVGGAIAASTTIGTAYALHTRCAKSVVRDWKRCRGYA